MLSLNNLYVILLIFLVYCASEGKRSKPDQIKNDLNYPRPALSDSQTLTKTDTLSLEKLDN